MYDDDELLPLSALQHFLFCPRQCALIHIEQAWIENAYTIEGELLHRRAHSMSKESRPGKRREFGMPIRSLALGLSGKTDAVEYADNGVVFVVEYKRGKPKAGMMDEVQLCAQAICLEEMRGIRIDEGALYYGKTRRRQRVLFTDDLRACTADTAQALHAFIAKGLTPGAVYDTKKCPRCSMAGVCLPAKTCKERNVARYLSSMFVKDGKS
jgi:CRISPR-associated exonuclease Cas4